MSEWDRYEYGWGEYWARRLDRVITEDMEGLGFRRVLVAESATERERLIAEQDTLDRRYGGGS